MITVLITEYRTLGKPSVYDVEAFQDGDTVGLWQHSTQHEVDVRLMAITDEFGAIDDIVHAEEFVNTVDAHKAYYSSVCPDCDCDLEYCDCGE